MNQKLLTCVPAITLMMGCFLQWRSHRQEALPLAAPLTSVLASAEGYNVTNHVISPEEQQVAAMTDYMARTYRRDSSVVFATFVAYYDSQTQGKTIHSPRNCLPGAGWEILSGGIRTVFLGRRPREVNRYILQNGRATAVAYYWYQGRGRVTASEYRVKWNLLRDAATIGRTEEALVRIIVPLRGGIADLPRADAVADSVAPLLMTDVARVLPQAVPTRVAQTRLGIVRHADH
jgi:EpsI family protein